MTSMIPTLALEREEEQSPQPDFQFDYSRIVTEDDTPVDNFSSEKHQRLLTEPLYSSWAKTQNGRKFIAAANVGVFSSPYEPPLVPDVFVSFDVEIADDWWEKRNRTYFIWEFKKPPEIVIELVSNRKGGEISRKMGRYARMGIPYYVIFDPAAQIQDEILQAYELTPVWQYKKTNVDQLDDLGLGLTLWQGIFEQKESLWLRWQDAKGNLILTGAELADQERQIADQERLRADHEQLRADRLAAKLAELGVDLENDFN